MSDYGRMARRYHAMLFPTGPQLDEVEVLRRAWDPTMAAEIPAHITLVYPVEHPGVEALSERVKSISERERAFRICLGDFHAFPPPDDGCVYIDVRDVDGRLADLRKEAAAPPFSPIEFPAHLTVIHPRTSDRAAEFWRAGCVQKTRSPLVIEAIDITSFENGKYAVEARFPLLTPETAMATCVGALIIRGKEVLLGCRAAHKSYPGCWDIPGGHVERGESPETALTRELAEEIGVAPLEWRLLSCCRFQDRGGWSDLLIYRVDSWAGDPFLANDEHVELRWFSLAEACDLERLAAEEYRPILRRLRDAS